MCENMMHKQIISHCFAMRHIFLLSLGFNVILAAVVPERKETLYDAVRRGNMKDVRNLINAGANVNVPNGNNSPLHLASGIGNKEIVKILITFHADVNAVDGHGRTPLLWAAFGGHEQIILILILNGAEPNQRTHDNCTPLYIAADRGHQKAVETLLLNGAMSIRNDNGKTPEDVALERGHTRVLQVLTQYNRPAWKACESYIERYATAIDRILGGRPAEAFEFPWMAALGYLNRNKSVQFDCGGTIISENFILTAAHCVKSRRLPIMVRVGNVSLTNNNNTTDHEVQEIIRHSKYSFLLKKNDIALIRLKTSIRFNNRTFPGCLRTDIHDVKPNVKLLVTGWGTTSAEHLIRSPVLLKTQMESVPLSRCNAMLGAFNERANLATFRDEIDESRYCAHDAQAKNDSCQGDSGGPLQHFPGGTNMAEIVGIVSYGVSCGSALPSLYTRVAYYLDWIESIVWPNIDTSTPYNFA